MSRLKDAPGSEDKAYDFLNAVECAGCRQVPCHRLGLRPRQRQGHGRRSTQEDLDASGYGDVDKFVDKTLFQSPVPPELKQKMIAEFEKIKAGY